MPLDTARNVATLRGLTAKFDQGMEAANPIYPDLCTLVRSQGADESYGWLGKMPGMREWIGDRQFATLRGAKFTLANKEWEASLQIERNDIEDDRLGLLEAPLAALGEEAAYHPDELLFDLIKLGESQECFDGQFFFDTDHSWGDSGSQSNDLTSDVVDPDAPTEAEFRTAYHAARAAMLGFKADNGKHFVRPTIRPLPNLLLVVPTDLEVTATKALTASLINGGDTNVVLDTPKIVASPHFDTLNNGRSFDLYNLGSRLKPFVFQARRPLTRQMKGLDDREFKAVKFMADARYNVGYLAWWSAVRVTLT